MTTKTKPTVSAKSSRTTKKAQLIRMLSAKSGANIATIGAKLGWQNHTTRAAITGLRKAGYDVTVERAEGGKPTRYKITAAPPPASGCDKPAEATEAVDAGES